MNRPSWPELAGVCAYADATRPGYVVADATRRLHRLAYVKQRLAIMCAAHLPSTPTWELKQALALHGWLDAEHAGRLYARIAELREPPPTPDEVPDPRLEAAMDEALASATTQERVGAAYAVLRPAFREAVARYLRETNPLCDQPSCRLLRHALVDEDDIASVGRPFRVAAVRVAAATTWAAHVAAYLAAAGGMLGDEPGDEAPPPARATRPYVIDILPRRDERFSGLFDTSTPADVVYLDESRSMPERNAALLFKRLREMDVPEVIAGIVAERWADARNRGASGPPWSYYVNMLRQMWDEARHAMLGEAALAARRIDWTRLPVNVTFSWKLARFCSPVERHVLLYAIEQSLMPRDKGKPYEHAIARASGDAVSALFHDYDWADEVLHVEIARRCLRPDLPGGLTESRARADALWTRIADGLAREPLPVEDTARRDWWRDYAKEVTGEDVAEVPETHVKDWRPVSG